jgi:hypothetical protein
MEAAAERRPVRGILSGPEFSPSRFHSPLLPLFPSLPSVKNQRLSWFPTSLFQRQKLSVLKASKAWLSLIKTPSQRGHFLGQKIRYAYPASFFHFSEFQPILGNFSQI